MKKKPAPSKTRIRVMIVDDHQVMRDGLRTLLCRQPDLTVVAEAENGEDALRQVEAAKPDVVLMDSSMPGMNGVEATRRLLKTHPQARVISLTLYDDSAYLDEMIAAGARGYVLKAGAIEVLVKAIRLVAGGGTYIDPDLSARAFALPRDLEAPVAASTLSELATEERAVVKLIAEGQSNAEIATALGFGLATVEARKAAAMQKLGVRNRAELVRVAASQRWMEPSA
jgi:DNA-binding NarL/FixJ family response regulator